MGGRQPLQEIGTEPDARFSFANERTLLAWNRTALSLIATGLAVTSLLPEFNLPGGRRLIGVPLIVLGGWLSAASYRRWFLNERSMRLRLPLPASRLGLVVAAGVTLAALVAAVVAAFGTS